MFSIQKNDQTITWEFDDALSFSQIKSHELNAKTNHKSLADFTSWIVDINHAKKIDSSGLSFLLLQKAYAKKINIHFKIIGFEKHPKVIELAKAQGVYPILF